MKKHPLTIFATALGLFALTSCGGDNNAKSDPQQDTTATTEEPEIWGFESASGSAYQVPSPNELFGIIKASKLTYKDGLVSTETVNYTSSKVQALNFGRLTADIAYTASYEKFQESITNFDNLRKVGNDLGISYVFDELMVNRVKTNMANSDSLEVISTDSYQNIISLLEENEKGSTLAIIAAGGFVESIFILTNMIGEYSDKNETIQRLADQKLVMENVLDYLNLFRDEERVLEVLTEIQPISDVFLNLDEVSVSKDVTTKGGKAVLGGNRIVITADEFNTLKTAATNYRNSFSNPNQG